MRRSTPFIAALALLIACALALSACGGEDAQLLPGRTAREIDANLSTVQRLAAEGDCVGAEGAVAEVGEQIEGLQAVDSKLQRALEKGAVRLDEVIAQCEEQDVEASAPEETTESEEADEDEEEEPQKPERGGKQQREGREEGQSGGKGEGGGGGPEPAAPEPPERSEEKPQGGGGAEGGGGESPPSGGGEEESQSGGVGPGTEAGAVK